MAMKGPKIAKAYGGVTRFGKRIPSSTYPDLDGSGIISDWAPVKFSEFMTGLDESQLWGAAYVPALGMTAWYLIWDSSGIYFQWVDDETAENTQDGINFGTYIPTKYENGTDAIKVITTEDNSSDGADATYGGLVTAGEGTTFSYLDTSTGEVEVTISGTSDEDPTVTWWVSTYQVQKMTNGEKQTDWNKEFDLKTADLRQQFENSTIDISTLLTEIAASRDASLYKKNMRLFGLPYQFTPEVDPRIATVSKQIGYHYMNNIMLEAPVITLIPGRPKYLSNVKDKDTTTTALLEAASGNFDAINEKLKNNSLKYIRYYDFQRAYIEYMRYVNILCRACAAFLELDEELDGVSLMKYDWKNYRWDDMNYNIGGESPILDTLYASIRDQYAKGKSLYSDGTWYSDDDPSLAETDSGDTITTENNDENTDSTKNTGYTGASATVNNVHTNNTGNNNTNNNNTDGTNNDNNNTNDENTNNDGTNTNENNNNDDNTTTKTKATKISEEEAIKAATTYVYGNTQSDEYKENKGFLYETDMNVEEDTTFINALENLLASYNFVQFCVDPDVNYSESAENSTTQSSIKSMLDSGAEKMKEIAFITNSTGANISGFQEFTDSAMTALSTIISNNSNNAPMGALSRVLSVVGNVLKGENIIMPDIYQSSTFNKSYGFTVHLKNIYGNRLGYYLEILVPLMHLLALGLPQQTTANTYGAPFLVKCMCTGCFTCNLGIVTNISIDRNVNPEGWTIDGLPNEIDVKVDIADLYSDLTMSPQDNPLLFLNNSSLIDYLATQCGLSLVNPQIAAKLNVSINTIGNAVDVKDLVGDANKEIKEKVQDFASGITGYGLGV